MIFRRFLCPFLFLLNEITIIVANVLPIKIQSSAREPPKPLPSYIQKLVDEATHGVIYVSLGTNAPNMSQQKLRVFLDVFATMKQVVLWKFNNESIQALPNNVIIKKMLPQADILAHPKVKVFITHGSLLDTQEAIHYAVPILGLPLSDDQNLIMQKATKMGYAISLKFADLTFVSLKAAITELIENPSFKQNVQRASEAFSDRSQNSRDTIMHWTDYFTMHQIAGVESTVDKVYFVDAIAVVLAAIVVLSAVLSRVIRAVYGFRIVKIKEI